MLCLIPYVAKEECFAIKGNMPRLSVDIDLTYLPLEPRDETLHNIGAALLRIANSIRNVSSQHYHVREGRSHNGTKLSKLFVSDDYSQVTIEPNEILRGSIWPSEIRNISKEVEVMFELSAEMRVLSIGDVYGGKFCVALNRQHPRDIFDIKLLMENEGITFEIRKAFVVYLASHDRPMYELLNPTKNDMNAAFARELSGMTVHPVSVAELVAARDRYIPAIRDSLPNGDRKFLLSLKECNPQWNLLGIDGIETLPAIQWKLINLKKMRPAKHKEQIQKLKEALEL